MFGRGSLAVGPVVGDACFLARQRSASNAGPRSWTDSSSGVNEGKKFRVGKMASSKTWARPVSRRVLLGYFSRKPLRISRPWRLTPID